MKVNRLADLPPPPPGQTGWPWTEEASRDHDQLAKVTWPKISLITPSFNQAEHLEKCIRSVLLQSYLNLEYFVVDGDSTDGSVEIIRKYEPCLAGWVSEPDRGQSHAINKGYADCTGEIVNWLGSDDWLIKGALHAVALKFLGSEALDVVSGGAEIYNQMTGRRFECNPPDQNDIDVLPINTCIFQPSTFVRRSAVARPFLVDEELHYVMDLELYSHLRFAGAKWGFLDVPLATYQHTANSKTATGGVKITYEIERVYRRYVRERVPLTWWQRRFRYPLEVFRAEHSEIVRCLVRPLQIALVLALGPFYGFRRVRSMKWGSFRKNSRLYS